MFERFTDRSSKIMALANQEAQRFNHERLGTEHILLGLVKEGSGVAANVLKNLDVDLRQVRLEVEKLLKPGPDMVNIGRLPQTRQAMKVIEYAVEESRGLRHKSVGSEHLLLGLLRERQGVAAQVLTSLGVTIEEARAEVFNLLGCGDEPVELQEDDEPSESDDTFPGPPSESEWDYGLDGSLIELLPQAVLMAQDAGAPTAGPEHVVLAALQDRDLRLTRALAALGVTAEALHQALRQAP